MINEKRQHIHSISRYLQLTHEIQSIPGVSRITEGYNPATWMLEITSPIVEAQLNLDFAELYSDSSLYQ